MTDDFERDPLARELRDSLVRHAAEAPRGDALAERIIRTAEQPIDVHERPRRSWRTWTLPLAAVGAVAAVVGTVIGIQSYHPTATEPGATVRPSVVQPPVRSPLRSTTAHPPAPSPSAPRTAESVPVGAPDLTGVKIQDLTFADNQGWALASAHCIHGSGRCTALLHTTDGTDWKSVTNGGFNVPGVKGCATPCVTNLRFASQSTGYAFGPSAFFMTTDGGASWQPQPGGAIALETLDGNVIRVTSPHGGCPSWCNVQVETSGIGSTTWTQATLPGTTPGFGVQLSRGGHDAYLLFSGHPAGGSSNATSLLYRSTNDGRTWSASGEPCPQSKQEVDSTAIAAGVGDRVSVLCMTRQAPQHWHVATSVNAGAHFRTQHGELPSAPSMLAGDPDTVLVAAGTNGMMRSADGGKTWQSIADVPGNVTWLGFESPTVGRAVTNRDTIWRTNDGGQTWRPLAFR